MSPDDVRAEYARLNEQFTIREEAYDRAVKRHRLEMDMLFADLAAAGSARDKFVKEHPEVGAP